MIGKLNHVAIVVPDLQSAARLYRDTLGARVSEALPLPMPLPDLLELEPEAEAKIRRGQRMTSGMSMDSA